MSKTVGAWSVLVLALLVLSCSANDFWPAPETDGRSEVVSAYLTEQAAQVDPDMKKRWWREYFIPMPCTRNHRIVEVADLRDMAENPTLYKGNCMVVADRLEYMEGYPILMKLCSEGRCIGGKFIGSSRAWIFEKPVGETCVVAYGWWHKDGLGGWNLGCFGVAFCEVE